MPRPLDHIDLVNLDHGADDERWSHLRTPHPLAGLLP